MRLIAILTGSRAEYRYSRPVIRRLASESQLAYTLIVTNQHLLPGFGTTMEEIEADGMNIGDRVYMVLDGYTPASMSKSLGIGLMGLTDSLLRLKPDILLVVGDRGEHLMGTIAAAHMGIPVAHIQAGELSGNIDGMTRHAITRFAHIHFASNQDAADRLRKNGEQEFRIVLAGAPQLDDLIWGEYAPPEEVAAALNLRLDDPVVVFAQHPVTEEYPAAVEQLVESLEAICALGLQTVAMIPNTDAGNDEMRRMLERYRRPFIRLERHLPSRIHSGLLRVANVLVGNSSSGLIEAPSFRLPAVNVGSRQRDRVRGVNVIDVPYERAAIRAGIELALSAEFRDRMQRECVNPYIGDGRVAERIVDVLRTVRIDERLLTKQLTY
jgi:GDP/UDP-N,N'-diacetylbacillosamine 2-epimerase (hydrolysing)